MPNCLICLHCDTNVFNTCTNVCVHNIECEKQSELCNIEHAVSYLDFQLRIDLLQPNLLSMSIFNNLNLT